MIETIQQETEQLITTNVNVGLLIRRQAICGQPKFSSEEYDKYLNSKLVKGAKMLDGGPTTPEHYNHHIGNKKSWISRIKSITFLCSIQYSPNNITSQILGYLNFP